HRLLDRRARAGAPGRPGESRPGPVRAAQPGRRPHRRLHSGRSGPVGHDLACLPAQERPMTAVAIVGAGSIGVAWAVVFARAGPPVALHDVDPDRLTTALGEAETRLADLARHGLATDPAAARSRIRAAATLPDALDDAEYVQECAAESLPLKHELFTEL